MLINKYIKDVIDEHNQTVEFIAEKTGYTIGRVQDIIHKNSIVSPTEANKILGVLGASLWDVLCNY